MYASREGLATALGAIGQKRGMWCHTHEHFALRGVLSALPDQTRGLSKPITRDDIKQLLWLPAPANIAHVSNYGVDIVLRCR